MARVSVGVTAYRPMAVPDLDQVWELEQRTYPQPWSRPVFEEELSAPGRTYLVATCGDSIIGYAGLMVVGDDAHVTTLVVDPESRGRRIGTRLLLLLIEAGLGAGAHNLTLEVRVSNAAAQALYRRFGLAPVGVRKNYYLDEDALVMWAHDIAGADYGERLREIKETLG